MADDISMRYAEELVREFLLFRGFTNTLQSFDTDLASDLRNGFQVDRILDLFFSNYIPRFEPEKLLSLLNFLNTCFFSPQEARFAHSVRKFETSLQRYYIVHALQKGRPDRVLDFFQRYGATLLQSGEDWHSWFALPYIKGPHRDPKFQVYFSREWLDALVVSFRNFLSEIFNGIRLPALVKVSSEILSVSALKHEVEKLRDDYAQLGSLLVEKEEAISQLKRAMTGTCQGSEGYSAFLANQLKKPTDLSKNCIEGDSSGLAMTATLTPLCDVASNENPCFSRLVQDQASTSDIPQGGKMEADLLPDEMLQGVDNLILEMTKSDRIGGILLEDDFPEVSIESQESFSGHTSPISRCRFSAGGANIASASIDGTVRIWNSDSESSTSRNATIYCGAEVMSLEWDYKSDRLEQQNEVSRPGMWMQNGLFVT